MKNLIGDATAHCKLPGEAKARYVRIGSAFKDNEYGSISLKIDSLPLPSAGWTGWINVFEKKERPAFHAAPPGPEMGDLPDDDIPF